MTEASDWKRLGEFVFRRRRELRLTQAEVQERGGPSLKTQGLIEHGNVYSIKQHTKSALEDALGWTRGSINNVLAGGDPALALPAGTGGRAEVLHEEPGERILIDIVDGVGELSAEERRQILALIRAMQAKQRPDNQR